MTYRRKPRRITADTSSPRAAAVSCAATHKSSGTRKVRIFDAAISGTQLEDVAAPAALGDSRHRHFTLKGNLWSFIGPVPNDC